MVFFIILSFIINFIAIFAIIVLYQRQNLLIKGEKKQKQLINELEEIFQSFILEMKEENEKLLEMVSKRQENPSALKGHNLELNTVQTSTNRGEIVQKIVPSIRQVQNVYKFGNSDTDVKEIEDYSKLMKIEDSLEIKHNFIKPNKKDRQTVGGQNNDKTSFEKQLQKHNEDIKLTLTEQVVSLYKEGLEPEEIAKKLNKGKTEIELLLKFNS
ncbi:hypothetical protein [Peribacillus tepidiphilus]|uniref:hypothetical protein n=1 Tax=Peribacillus tepidiphilus TaxID=2652445 RepID=UPI0035B5513A